MRLIGIDIGGTFTDTLLVDDDENHAVKTKTTEDPVEGVKAGIKRVCDRAGISPADVDVLSHGSTVAVNALIERTGARTALVTTDGFRDVLEIGEGFRDASLLYAPCGDRESPLIPRRRRYGVEERLDANGDVMTPVNFDDLDGIVEELRDADVEAVAVSLLHAYRNEAHERAVADRIAGRLPDVALSISSEVSPEIREYDRTGTTAVDAYVKPTVTSYLSRLIHELESMGLSATVHIMKSDGGLARPNVTSDRPVTQLISGPVAGVKAAESVAAAVGVADVLTLDMGGTSCDAALIQNGSPVEVPHREIHGMKINGPFTNINTVGAGGGSIASLDEVNALRVGPESAGADPGPVCYGRGGTRPTVTDADLVLGLLNPENFAGGTMDLDLEAGREAIGRHLADPLDMDVEAAALSVRNVINAEIADAIRVVSVDEGIDPREFSLMGFGGAGPMHACDVARELDVDEVVFPSNPGVHSSLGLLVSDIRHEYRRSLVTTADDVDVDHVRAVVDELVDQGTGELASENIDPSDREFTVSFDAMYAGQAHYINVAVEGTDLTEETLGRLVDDFEREHERRYGFVDEENPVELVNVRVTAEGDVVDPEPAPPEAGVTDRVEDARQGIREVVVDRDRTVDAPFYDWSGMGAGHELVGPAVVEQENSTVWVPPAFELRVDPHRNMIATVEGER